MLDGERHEVVAVIGVDFEVLRDQLLGTASELEDAQVTFGTEIGDHPTWMTVVGVARNVKHYGIDKVMRPGLYQPLRQSPLCGFSLALRVHGDSESVMPQARAVTADMDS